MKITMIKNILFDFGGVLIDADLEASSEKFRSLGMENISEYLNLYCQNGLFYGVESGELDRDGFRKAFSEVVKKEVSDTELEDAWMAIVKGINLDKLKWIEAHRGDLKFYLLSNINPYVFDWAESEDFTELGKPIGYYFDKMFASYQIKLTKPKEDVFKYVMENAPLKPEETLFVDDGAKNIETAQRLGFQTYQPQNGENWIAKLEELLGWR